MKICRTSNTIQGIKRYAICSRILKSIKKNIPELKTAIASIIRAELYNRNFNQEEVAIAQTSPYLRHVDFSLLIEKK